MEASPHYAERMTAAPRPATTAPRFARDGTARAWCVHGITASGVFLGALGLEAVVRNHPRAAIFWLVAAMIVDGIDGPVARAWQVQSVLPTVDGNVLDLVVDYLTCVVVPVAFMAHFNAFPPGYIVPMSALVLFTAVLWFARRDLMTEDHWFRGFPAIWNLVAPSFFLLRTPTGLNVVITVALCVLTLTSVKFVHPVQVLEHRAVNIGVTAVWMAAMVWLTLAWPETPVAGRFVLLAAPAWFAYITIVRTWRGDPVAPGFAIGSAELTHLLVVDDLGRSVRFYRDVLGARVTDENSATSCVLDLCGSRVLLVTSDGPTPDTAAVTFATPVDPDVVSQELTITVPDCAAAYRVLAERGAEFLTPPLTDADGIMTRCCFRDPDRHLLALSECAPGTEPSS